MNIKQTLPIEQTVQRLQTWLTRRTEQIALPSYAAPCDGTTRGGLAVRTAARFPQCCARAAPFLK